MRELENCPGTYTRHHTVMCKDWSAGATPDPGGSSADHGVRPRDSRTCLPPQRRFPVLARLGCLFILLPLLELALLIRVGQWMGLWPTITLVALTGMIGALLARREGTRALASVRAELASGRIPARSLLDGAAVLVGGAFLLTPGILTDVVGFALLLPVSRRPIYEWVRRRWEAELARGAIRITMAGRAGGYRAPGDWDRSADAGPASEGGEGNDDDERPPRPGEIVQ